MHAFSVNSGYSSPSNTVTVSVQTNRHRQRVGDEGQVMVLHESILGLRVSFSVFDL